MEQPDRGLVEGLLDRIEGEGARIEGDDGQTAAVHRNRIAELHALGDLGRLQGEARELGAWLERDDPPYGLHDAGEHGRSLASYAPAHSKTWSSSTSPSKIMRPEKLRPASSQGSQ